MPSFAEFGNQLYTGERSIDFIGRRRVWYLTAATLMLLSVVALVWGGLTPGIEFSGGSEFRVPQVSDTSELKGQDAVDSVVPHSEARTSVLGTDSVRVQTERLNDTQTDEVRAALARAYGVPEDNITSSFVGPSWGNDVSRKALQGLIVFLVLVAIVISVYFRTWKMAAAALIALLHDLVITVGVYSAVGFEVTPASVIGFLTILGYSLYDTVVVFDKVRENTEHITSSTKRTFGEAANLAVNQTLVRSINTSVVALLPVASILFIGALLLGAGTLKDLSLALLVGMAAGTYSSIGIATPLLHDLRRREPEIAAQAQRVMRRRREEQARLEELPDAAAAGREPDGSPTDEGGPALAPAGRVAAPPRTTGRPARQGQRQQPRRGGGGRGGRQGKRR
jgi:preprotein translocase subunit SecF